MTDFLAKNLAFLLQGDKDIQAEVARKSGVTQPTISKWARLAETGTEPGFRSMARLCAALGVSMDDLAFRDIKSHGLSEASQSARLDEATMAQAVELLHLIADARPDDQRFARPSWAMIRVAAKAIQKASGGGQRAVIAQILAELPQGD